MTTERASMTTEGDTARSRSFRESAVLICPRCGARSFIEGALIFDPKRRCAGCEFVPSFMRGVAITNPEVGGRAIGMDPTSFDHLASLEAGHFWFETRRNMIVALVKRTAPTARDYIEFGCGGGFILSEIARSRRWRRIVGIDLHVEALAIARSRASDNVEFIQSASETELVENAFDFVGAYDVLEHIEDDVGALRAMRRALRPGGRALFTVPQHPWLWSAADNIALHQRRYRRGELEEKLRQADFEPVFSTSFNALLLPAAILSRLLPAQDGAKRMQAEERPGAAANAALRLVLSAETALTRLGIRWPVGVSRVVAAKTAAGP